MKTARSSCSKRCLRPTKVPTINIIIMAASTTYCIFHEYSTITGRPDNTSPNTCLRWSCIDSPKRFSTTTAVRERSSRVHLNCWPTALVDISTLCAFGLVAASFLACSARPTPRASMSTPGRTRVVKKKRGRKAARPFTDMAASNTTMPLLSVMPAVTTNSSNTSLQPKRVPSRRCMPAR